MKLTPGERRERIYEIADADEEYRKLLKEFVESRQRFEKFADCLPKKIRNLLWGFPGMGYFAHHRMLTLICQQMKFQDEE